MQYSIRHLLVLTFFIAIFCAIVFAIPSPAATGILGIGLLSLPMVVVVGVIYALDWRRTFFIGALAGVMPFLLALLFNGPSMMMFPIYDTMDEEGDVTPNVKFALAAFYVFVACNGVAAILVRWLVMPKEATKTSSPALSGASQVAVVSGRLVTEIISQEDADPASSREELLSPVFRA